MPLRESILLHLTSRQQKLVTKLIRVMSVMVSDHPGIASFGTQSHLVKQVPYAGELEECGNPAAVGVGAKGQRGRGRSRVVVSHDGDGRKRVLFSRGRSFAKERSLRIGSNIASVASIKRDINGKEISHAATPPKFMANLKVNQCLVRHWFRRRSD